MAKHDKRVKYQSEADKPVMLSLRVPRELNDRLERYASEHRQKVSELVRDAIEMRLEVEADPRSRRAESTADETLEQLDGASILRDVQATLARHETQMHVLMQAIGQQTTPSGNGLHEDASYGVIHSHTDVEPVEPENTAEPEPGKTGQQDTILEYDTTRYQLGRLCRNGHSYHGTGQSLRQSGGDHECLTCKRERTHKSRSKATKAAAS